MHAIYSWLIPALWLVWLLYWLAAAFAGKPVRRRESWGSRLSHTLPLCLAILLMVPARPPAALLSGRFSPPTVTGFWIGAALTAGGLVFSIAARIYLGGNWSGTVTLKQDHTLVRSGPYRFVRHPIYTGLLAAVLGGAIAGGEWRGLIGLFLVAIALLGKIRTEERFMTEQFGAAYDRYRREVAALFPGVVR